jgi:hypothetical protein
MKLTVVCISRQPETFDLPYPFYCLDKNLPGYPIEQIAKSYSNSLANRDWKSSLDYISYLAEKRNRAVMAALKEYPETTDIFSCDSYYLHQDIALNRLISDYSELKAKGLSIILGGAVWGKNRTRISHLLKMPDFYGKDWYDKWGVPELRWAPYKWNPATDWLAFRMRVPLEGLYRTKNVSGMFIFPREVWDNGIRFEAPSDLHGVELSSICEKADLPIYIDFNAAFERGLVYSVIKCIRCSLGLGRFLP